MFRNIHNLKLFLFQKLDYLTSVLKRWSSKEIPLFTKVKKLAIKFTFSNKCRGGRYRGSVMECRGATEVFMAVPMQEKSADVTISILLSGENRLQIAYKTRPSYIEINHCVPEKRWEVQGEKSWSYR